MKSPLALALCLALGLPVAGSALAAPNVAEAPQAVNPFFAASTLPLQYPHFDLIRDEHFAPALERGMAEQRAEIAAITANKEAPSFENTILPMERSGALLTRTANVFGNMIGAHTNDALNAVQREFAPKFAAHGDAILLDDALFARVKAVFDNRDKAGLDAESKRLVERYYTDFVRAGAELSAADKDKLKAFNSELAALQASFGQNVLAETNASALPVSERERLKGLSDGAITATEQAAKSGQQEASHLITLQNTSGQPPLAALEDRSLREALQQASINRGARGGETDNREVAIKLAKLRAERAKLLGYSNHAAYMLEDQTAKSVDTVNQLLSGLAPAAVANARREAEAMQTLIDETGGEFQLAAWDWAYYSDKLRAKTFNFDAAQLRPYFELENVLQKGVFFAATKLYGLTFKERRDLPVYHPDARVFDVYDADGSLLAIFIADLYARPSKRGGAWMNEYVSQSKLIGSRPVIGNHLNIPKPAEGEATLLTFDEVTTLFHEFGHALHGMFSDVRYLRFAGTSVPTDFVEYPSQVNEMWATWPEVLANYAKHYQTGEPIPQALLDKVIAAEQYGQGFATTEYLGAALLDQAWHQLTPDQVPADALAFEAEALKKVGLDYAPIPPRYRSTYFSHIFAGGYSAGYYSYLWSEVLDADSVEWFKENGGLKRENGDHFRRTLLSQGGAREALDLFAEFRGRKPDINPLLKRRGLAQSEAAPTGQPAAAQ